MHRHKLMERKSLFFFKGLEGKVNADARKKDQVISTRRGPGEKGSLCEGKESRFPYVIRSKKKNAGKGERKCSSGKTSSEKGFSTRSNAETKGARRILKANGRLKGNPNRNVHSEERKL